jgi:hypothetical protein
MAFVRAKGPDGSEFIIDEGALEALGAKKVGDAEVDSYGNPLALMPSDTTDDGKSSKPKGA